MSIFPGLDIPPGIDAKLKKALELLSSYAKGSFDFVLRSSSGRTWKLGLRDTDQSSYLEVLARGATDGGWKLIKSIGLDGIDLTGEPFASLHSDASGQTVPGGTVFTALTFATVERDFYTLVATPAGSWSAKIPAGRAGLYQISALITFAAALPGGVSAQLDVFKNGSGTRRLGWTGPTAGSTLIAGSTVLYCAEGDVLDIRCAQSNGAGLTLSPFSSDNCVSVTRLVSQ